jgi:hypothetical protein
MWGGKVIVYVGGIRQVGACDVAASSKDRHMTSDRACDTAALVLSAGSGMRWSS